MFRVRHFALTMLLFTAAAAAAQAQTPAARGTTEETSTVTARVEKVDKIARSLTVKTEQGTTHTIFCGKELTAFDSIKTGDTVTARFVESYIAEVKPGAKMEQMKDTTVDAKKAGGAAADVMQQLKMVVKVDEVDPQKGLIVYRTADNRVVTRLVRDPKLVAGLKRGDVVEVTYTKERALELTKKK